MQNSQPRWQCLFKALQKTSNISKIPKKNCQVQEQVEWRVLHIEMILLNHTLMPLSHISRDSRSQKQLKQHISTKGTWCIFALPLKTGQMLPEMTH